jgi:hypothetical protein
MYVDMPAQTWDCTCGAMNDPSSPVCFACGRARVGQGAATTAEGRPFAWPAEAAASGMADASASDAPDVRLAPAEQGNPGGPPGQVGLLTRTGDRRAPLPPPVRPTLLPPG